MRTGPDGALYVVDMYRLTIEHPKWIPEAWLKIMGDLRAGLGLDERNAQVRLLERTRKARPHNTGAHDHHINGFHSEVSHAFVASALPFSIAASTRAGCERRYNGHAVTQHFIRRIRHLACLQLDKGGPGH